MVVVACCVFLWFMVVVQVVVGCCLHNLANMRIVGCHQGCCILGHSCYDDQLLWSLVVAFWWFMVVVQLIVIWDCLHKQWRYYEDHWLLSCYFGTVEVVVVSPQDNFHMLPLLIFRYLLFVGSVWWWLCVPQDNFHMLPLLIFRYICSL